MVLDDFDVAGFSIFGTLGTTNRRYVFENRAPLIDVGLRLSDVQAMDLESEPVTVSGDWAKRAATCNGTEPLTMRSRSCATDASS